MPNFQPLLSYRPQQGTKHAKRSVVFVLDDVQHDAALSTCRSAVMTSFSYCNSTVRALWLWLCSHACMGRAPAASFVFFISYLALEPLLLELLIQHC